MTDPIAVGDLVQVVRWPCCGKLLGYISTVQRFDTTTVPGTHCCGAKYPPSGIEVADIGMAYVPTDFLKRIPPLSELEGVKTDEPLKEPA